MGLGKFFTGAFYGRYDKTVHFFVSAAITVVLLTLLPWWVAATVAFAIGLLKELYDWIVRKTSLELGDLAVDAAGIGLVVVVYLVALVRPP